MVKMLAIIACLGGIFAILMAEEIFYRKKILKGENLRKFVHISSGIFIAFWPWLISWRSIQLIGLAMLTIIWLNHRLKTLHVGGSVKRKTYGFYFFALVLIIAPALTSNKIFFSLAILNMAVADGMAAIIGTAFGKKSEYRVFGQLKSLVGTMAFWLTSLFILGIGLLFLHDTLSFKNYVILLITLPPGLASLENLGGMGLDNVLVPMAVILALRLAT